MGPDWQAVADFLARPGTLGPATEVIETHTARVFLSGDQAWKLRRPVDYGWLDYASRATRRRMAEREIAWNSPTAPGLYLGLGGVTAGPRLVRPGDAVPDAAEPLVVMHRFDQADLFDRMAADGRLDLDRMRQTGSVIASMHRTEPAEPAPPDIDGLLRQECADLEGLAEPLGRDGIATLTRSLRERVAALRDLAATRRVRRCHGDLHLRNIVLWQGRPAPFDCIEFNADLARIDPLYDLAFLLMDLEHRGHGELGPAVLSAWAEGMAAEPGADVATAYDGFALFPLYKAFRADIRAKIGALSADGPDAEAKLAEARTYVALGQAYLDADPRPRLIAVGGRSGSGKSLLAREIAALTGALVIRSDAVRKGLAGVAMTDRLPPESYTPEAAARVYAAMTDRAGRALAGGMPVILDAAHLDPQERATAEAIARTAGVPFDGVWLDAPRETLKTRAAARQGDVSDATGTVVDRQFAEDVGAISWKTIDASGDPDAVVSAARAALEY